MVLVDGASIREKDKDLDLEKIKRVLSQIVLLRVKVQKLKNQRV